MAPIAEANEIILLTPGSGSPDITNAGDYIFRNLASDDYTAKKMAEIAINDGVKEIAIIVENKDYPVTLTKAFKEYFENNEGKVVFEEHIENKEFRTTIAKIKNIEHVYIVTQTADTANTLFKQMKELSYFPKIYASESVICETTLKENADLLEGAKFTTPAFNEKSEVLIRYKEFYGEKETLPPIYLETYYDALFLIVNAMKQPDAREYLYNVEYNGEAGIVKFDKNGDVITKVEAKQVINGIITS